MNKLNQGVVLITLLMGICSVGWADVVEPGFVETCTLEKVTTPNEVCEACSTYYAEHDKCTKKYEETEYTKKCRTRGASTWTEIWCKPKKDAVQNPNAAPSPEENEPVVSKPTQPSPSRVSGGCSTMPGQGPIWPLVVVLGVLGVAVRRRAV